MTDNELIKWCLDYIEEFHMGCFDDDETDRIIEALRKRVANPKRPMTYCEIHEEGEDHERKAPGLPFSFYSFMMGVRFAEKRMGGNQ